MTPDARVLRFPSAVGGMGAEDYGRFTRELSADELAGCFFFTDDDRSRIAARRRDASRLGFAVQLGTVRYLGRFMGNPADVPRSVLAWTSREIGPGREFVRKTGVSVRPESPSEQAGLSVSRFCELTGIRRSRAGHAAAPGCRVARSEAGRPPLCGLVTRTRATDRVGPLPLLVRGGREMRVARLPGVRASSHGSPC